MNYRRCIITGGTYFFTLVTYHRRKIFINPERVDILRNAFRYIIERHSFEVDACVILPDHIHTVWTLPEDDYDFSTRVRLLKSHFTHHSGLTQTDPPIRKGGQPVWQNRFWEHLIRDEADFRRHVDYIHYNPVKHGLARSPLDWPFSSFHRYVKDGILPKDWGMSEIHPAFSIDGD